MDNASKLEAVFGGRCPRCRRGKIFQYSFYHLTKFDRMFQHCPVCGLRYEIEPGYFYGAMYVSYALSGGIALAMGFLISLLLPDASEWTYVGIICPAILLFAPLNFRISRIVWLHYVSGIRYEPGAGTG